MSACKGLLPVRASFTAFGYRKNPSDKHKLVVDEPAAEVVREIFALAAGGKSAAEIARILNERKTPTRLQRQWERGINFKPKHNMGDYLWENTTVLAVIRNPIYKGTLIQNRYETVGFGDNKKIIEREKSEWSVVSEDDLKQCSVLEVYDGNILSKLIDRVYIYNDGNLQVVFKNDDYFRTVCEEGIG